MALNPTSNMDPQWTGLNDVNFLISIFSSSSSKTAYVFDELRYKVFHTTAKPFQCIDPFQFAQSKIITIIIRKIKNFKYVRIYSSNCFINRFTVVIRSHNCFQFLLCFQEPFIPNRVVHRYFFSGRAGLPVSQSVLNVPVVGNHSR